MEFLIVVLLIISVLIYFLPSLIGQHKENSLGIFLLNLLLGWTFLGWVVSLLWAVVSPRKIVHQNSGYNLRKCPYCAEYVKEEAKICKHCRMEIPDNSVREEIINELATELIVDNFSGNKEIEYTDRCPHCGVAIAKGATRCFSCWRQV